MRYQREKSLFNQLLRKEKQFFDSQFLAPVHACGVSVKISGVLVELRVSPENFSGWGVFETKDGKIASLTREANRREKQEYINLFPSMSFMITNIKKDVAFGKMISQHQISFNGEVPILLTNNVEVFDVVTACFNGKHIWFDSINRRFPRNVVIDLKSAIKDMREPKNLNISGSSSKVVECYSEVYDRRIKGLMDNEEYRIKNAIQRGGGQYASYKKDRDSFIVTYRVNGRNITSRVSDNLRVQSAGICLDGTDHLFDLQSLVGVIREGEETGQIYEMGV